MKKITILILLLCLLLSGCQTLCIAFCIGIFNNGIFIFFSRNCISI